MVQSSPLAATLLSVDFYTIVIVQHRVGGFRRDVKPIYPALSVGGKHLKLGYF
jgi:hypothetical protein